MSIEFGYRVLMLFGMMIIPIIVIGLFIFIIVKLVINNDTKNDSKKEVDNSLKILNERFARGEIGEEEYKAKKELLK